MSEWIYGRQPVFEFLNSGVNAKKLYVSSLKKTNEISSILKLVHEKKIPIEAVDKRWMDQKFPENHQGILLEIEAHPIKEFKNIFSHLPKEKNHYVTLLDEIQDPQNLGAIIRSAVCFGCSALVLPKWRSASMSPGVIKSSSGALAHLPIFEISNLTVAIERLKEKGFFVLGTDVQSTVSLESVTLQFPLAVLFGNEHRGLKPILKKQCDSLVAIPQTTKIASLNVSVSAAITFYEIFKRIKI
ncbi:MAG: 23S rRNA (guanosine(2251)-2'-O)-methyltransferase RlmB [Elusimicrobia bacterium RIFCSPLOWO2_02_FULL_39_32]|nr:MAG: 23S rRNA (guanosine(2251)-2'-O)-methyltransferase RlmB [Elusimicrobia bacterium GWA2_38_7]OGR80028.1 MAG: 23S rRNA (guanosine(2251)-2'-O)-methyltransferase RlmB [Elusimicrobia bacterium RIFCSPHIGHO2_02_FULL_39_36]OGR91177.1 MAG: 23S rRNA (guanosine(2251)-2'-O)-methyltransferase RlmB [Elusimicrobia bacterium RIFCSPLOWO2_02_FULL_39_32]OGS00145.1 MAG: 23S rRNA (guanosine(2251)-2'-O)-methyltransferase RlmB [Elusimicrobia bacterium RIFCSPLOWO2_12_FULL_39_28]